MKLVCKYCGGKQLIRWGDRRRHCKSCDRTFSVLRAGRKPSRSRDMHLLDRSTYRRIGQAFTFLQYQKLWNIPKTTNRLEGYISNLNARLKAMRGLKNPANAGRILNVIHYFLRSTKD